MHNQDSIDKVSGYVGNNVKVNLGGPESLPGRLLTVQSDYLALDTKKDGIVYYPLQHVKSVSINSEDYSRSSRRMRFNPESNFHNVIRSLHHKKVKINRGGPESVQGVVSNVFDNHLELTVNNDIIFISIYHIKSISQVGKDGRSSGNRSSGKKGSGNRSSGNQSSGNRSSGRSSNRRRRSTSGNRSTSGRTSGRNRSSRTTGRSTNSRNDPRTSRIFEALAAAENRGTDSFMFNDPTGSTGRSRSSRQSRSSSGNRRSRSTGSGRIGGTHRGRSSRGSGRSSSGHRSSRSSGCRSTSGRRSSRSSSHRSSSGRRSSRGSGRRRSSRGRNRRSSGHRRSRRRRRNSGTFEWNGMSVRTGGWIKLN